jgi:hypothetical protein
LTLAWLHRRVKLRSSRAFLYARKSLHIIIHLFHK